MQKQADGTNAGWGQAEEQACGKLIDLALAEDLGQAGDVTCAALIDPAAQGTAHLIVREPGVVAGLLAVRAVFNRQDPAVRVQLEVMDGEQVKAGQRLGLVSGPQASLLTAERTALNFLQRLSGIATQTRRFVDAIAGLPTHILDTRKTVPGWRVLEKYAVRCGGGTNHRLGLFDAVLIKDNHLAALAGHDDPVGLAIEQARKHVRGRLPIEVEVGTLEELERALAARPDRILLDNMSVPMLAEAVRRRNRLAPGLPMEASGGVTLDSVRQIAETSVEFISIGALTHSARALDIALEYQRA